MLQRNEKWKMENEIIMIFNHLFFGVGGLVVLQLRNEPGNLLYFYFVKGTYSSVFYVLCNKNIATGRKVETKGEFMGFSTTFSPF